jgi:hypothetical protein
MSDQLYEGHVNPEVDLVAIIAEMTGFKVIGRKSGRSVALMPRSGEEHYEEADGEPYYWVHGMHCPMPDRRGQSKEASKVDMIAASHAGISCGIANHKNPKSTGTPAEEFDKWFQEYRRDWHD